MSESPKTGPGSCGPSIPGHAVPPPTNPLPVGGPNPPVSCVYGIPLNVPIPRSGETCPFLGKGRKFFHARIKDGVLIQLRITGSKKGPGDVFGPSVCDAKFKCVCALRIQLEALRARRAGGST